MRKLDHFTLGCLTFLVVVALAAVVLLVVTNHDSDVRSAVVAISGLLGAVATIASVQSVRNGVGKTNASIENGVLKDKIKEGVGEYMEQRAQQYADSERLKGEDN